MMKHDHITIAQSYGYFSANDIDCELLKGNIFSFIQNKTYAENERVFTLVSRTLQSESFSDEAKNPNAKLNLLCFALILEEECGYISEIYYFDDANSPRKIPLRESSLKCSIRDDYEYWHKCLTAEKTKTVANDVIEVASQVVNKGTAVAYDTFSAGFWAACHYAGTAFYTAERKLNSALVDALQRDPNQTKSPRQ